MTYYACTSLRYRDCGGGGGVGNSLEFGWKGDKGGRNYMGGIRNWFFSKTVFVCVGGGGKKEFFFFSPPSPAPLSCVLFFFFFFGCFGGGGGARERKRGIEGNYTSRSSKRKNERERRRGVVGLEESGKGKKKNKFRYFIVIDVKRVRFFFIFFFLKK